MMSVPIHPGRSRVWQGDAMHDTARPDAVATTPRADRCDRYGVFPECPLCGGALHAEHAHFKCGGCGWRDSCCD